MTFDLSVEGWMEGRSQGDVDGLRSSSLRKDRKKGPSNRVPVPCQSSLTIVGVVCLLFDSVSLQFVEQISVFD